jgi:hypothetical protein
MLDPYDIAQIVRHLVESADKRGLAEDVLDEAVHDSASAEASRVNNSGIAEQIKYLVAKEGPAGVRAIEKIIRDAAEPESHEQFVLVEFNNGTPGVYRFVSQSEFAIDTVADYYRRTEGFNEERDSLTFIDPPTTITLPKRKGSR